MPKFLIFNFLESWSDLARVVSTHQPFLIQSANALDTVLGTFELPTHTLGYLGVLYLSIIFIFLLYILLLYLLFL